MPSEELAPGQRIGKYLLVRPIARGGMGVVWLAQRGEGPTAETLAIKTIDKEHASDEHFERMFLDEARIATRIVHPNVARTFELGAFEGQLYLAMEHVEGTTLSRLRRALSKRGERMPVGLALRIVAEACAGLHAAHELRDDRGRPLDVVHRDASPHNVMIGLDGAVKLIDFGVARAKGRLAQSTNLGELKGKLVYMAREQVTSRDLDRRVDVYAMGACLHELLSGRAPFPGGTGGETARRLIAREPPRPLPDDVPSVVRSILDRSLVHDRDARFATAEAMRSACEEALRMLRLSPTAHELGTLVRLVCGEELDAARELHAARAILEAKSSSSAATITGTTGDSASSSNHVSTSLATSAPRSSEIVEPKRPRRHVVLLLSSFALLGAMAWLAHGALQRSSASASASENASAPSPASVAPMSAAPTCDGFEAKTACVDRAPVGVAEYGACATCAKPKAGCAAASSAARTCVDLAAAEAYCASRGKRLPSSSEWEAAPRAPLAGEAALGEWTSDREGGKAIVRGGSPGGPTFRSVVDPSSASPVIGFRCAKPL